VEDWTAPLMITPVIRATTEALARGLQSIL
jgi:hypothetical protein